MKKLIFVLLDGLNAQRGFSYLGFMNHTIERGLGACYTVRAELPAMSRPLYETLQTGKSVWDHGIVSNSTARPSREDNLFSLSKAQGKVTAAAAYHWVCELYDSYPFQKRRDRFRLAKGEKEGSSIDYGIYYWNDDYPAQCSFSDGDYLRQCYKPDYLFIHPMAVDYAGHRFGGDAKEYGESIMEADTCLAHYLPLWLADGYQVMVTADHGMNASGFHVGGADEERLVPLFIFGKGIQSGDFRQEVVSQLEMAPLCGSLLGLTHGMKGGERYFAPSKV